MERRDTQQGYTHIKETTQGKNYTERGKGKHRERRLNGEEREDIQREEIYTESLEKTRRGDYIEGGLHGKGRGICTERRLYRKGTTQRREKDLHGDGTSPKRRLPREGTTWSGDYMKRRLHGKETT